MLFVPLKELCAGANTLRCMNEHATEREKKMEGEGFSLSFFFVREREPSLDSSLCGEIG